MKKRTYHIRRVDGIVTNPWSPIIALATGVAVATALLYVLALGPDRWLRAILAGIVGGATVFVLAATVFALQRRGMTIELEPLDDDGADDQPQPDEPDEDEIPMAEPAEPEPAKPNWYDMPYPDPDAEDADEQEQPADDSAATSQQKHWSENGYPDPDTEKS
jgi:hypothetical protein